MNFICAESFIFKGVKFSFSIYESIHKLLYFMHIKIFNQISHNYPKKETSIISTNENRTSLFYVETYYSCTQNRYSHPTFN